MIDKLKQLSLLEGDVGVADIIMMVEEIIGRKRMVLMIDNPGVVYFSLSMLRKGWVGYTVG